MYGSPVGTTRVTSSQELVPTQYHARVFNINFMSAGTSSTIKLLTNGVAGTVLIQEQNTGSNPKTVDFGVNGVEFPNGVWVTLDAQTSYATISYRREESNL